MFDLEQAIVEWRKQMLAAGITAPATLAELESHLREEIERQMVSGMSEPEAFEVANLEIGKANLLNQEFQKMDRIWQPREWKGQRTRLVGSLGVASLIMVAFLLLNTELTLGQRLSGLAAVAAMDLLAGLGLTGSAYFPVIPDVRTRFAVCLSAVALVALLWAAFFWVLLPRVDFTPGQLALAALWVLMSASGCLAGFIGGLEKAAVKTNAPATS